MDVWHCKWKCVYSDHGSIEKVLRLFCQSTGQFSHLGFQGQSNNPIGKQSARGKGEPASTMFFSLCFIHKLKENVLIWQWTKLQERRKGLLLNLIFYCIDSLGLWVLEFVGGTSKVTQDIVASVMQEDIFNLKNIPKPPNPRCYLVMGKASFTVTLQKVSF